MKNKILKFITKCAIIIMTIAACFADSESNVPLIVFTACLVWISLYLMANRNIYY